MFDNNKNLLKDTFLGIWLVFVVFLVTLVLALNNEILWLVSIWIICGIIGAVLNILLDRKYWVMFHYTKKRIIKGIFTILLINLLFGTISIAFIIGREDW